jgi:hypothetical protein
MWAALGTNERFSAGAPTALRLSTFNSAYTQRVKWMKEQDKWRDQHNKLVTAVTPEESIQLRVKDLYIYFYPWTCTFTSMGPPTWVTVPVLTSSKALQQFRKL